MVMIKYVYIKVRIEIIWLILIGIDCIDILNYVYSELNLKVFRILLLLWLLCYCIMIFIKYMLYFIEKIRRCKRRNRKLYKR